MTDAVPFDLQQGTAKQVERCHCPLGYTGLSCEVTPIFSPPLRFLGC